MQVQPRPTANEMFDRYAALLGEIVAALDAEFGARPWGPRPGRTKGTLTVCEPQEGVDPDLRLRRLYAPHWCTEGQYDADVAPVIDPILDRHGFTPLTEAVGDAYRLRRADDGFGGALEFVETDWTVVSLRTGCHELIGGMPEFPLDPSGQP